MVGSKELRVVLLEDNPADVRLIQESLREVNVECHMEVLETVKEGLAYLAKLKSDRQMPTPTLFLIDIKVPGGSGLDVLREIRGIPILNKVPCLMLTTSEYAEDIQQAKDNGATTYYVKPRDFEGMLQFAKELEMFWLERNE